MYFSKWRSKPSEAAKGLIATAMGRSPADIVIKNGNLINVNTREIEENVDVAIKHDRIALVGDARDSMGSETLVIDASGSYIAPGLIDAHMHIESSMITPTQFARAVLPNGTTTVFVDPHEIGNVSGLYGIRYMVEESIPLPLKVFFTLPSCIPALPEFETPGAEFGPKEIELALR